MLLAVGVERDRGAKLPPFVREELYVDSYGGPRRGNVAVSGSS